MRSLFAAVLLSTGLLACSPNSGIEDGACTSAGGTCVNVDDCTPSQGHLNTADCVDFGANICCLPLSACPAVEPLCCGSGFSNERPYCDNGVYGCGIGASVCTADGGT